MSIPLPIIEFRKFPKIPRFNRDIVITEKIDGTNAQIYITEDVCEMLITAGSRNRWLTPEKDNHGFAAWVEEHKDELITGLGPGRHYGEWWGRGINRGYGLDHKRFSLFNVQRWIAEKDSFYYTYDNKVKIPPACCHVVPILQTQDCFSNEVVENRIQLLRQWGSVAAPGFMQPEGIVIYHTAGKCMFKVTLENDEWKEQDNVAP